MIKIILCDDDAFILGLEREKLGQIIKKNFLKAQVVCVTSSYQEVFQFIEANPDPYLCFVDLDFGEAAINGIDIAKMIKKKQPLSKIVFVTNHHEMALEVLKSGVEPFGFIEKNPEIKEMEEAYFKYIYLAMQAERTTEDHLLEGDDKESMYIELAVSAFDKVKVELSNILYVEAVKTVSHGIAYHTMDGSIITVRDTIENVLAQLGDHFIKIHRSVLVRKQCIIGFEEGNVKLINGECVTCSFRLRGQVRQIIEANR